MRISDGVPDYLQQEPKQVAHGKVIINYGYRSVLGLGHIRSHWDRSQQTGPKITSISALLKPRIGMDQSSAHAD